MKKLIAVLVVLIFVGTNLAQNIAGSAHDFSDQGWGTSEICLPCHTPHFGDLTVADAPLWNHEVTAATFTLYDSPTLDASDLGQPEGASKLCLSCHDGTVALDSYGGSTGSNIIPGHVRIGTDLSDDHPVSFTYNTTLATADGGLFDPSTANSGLGGTITEDMLFSDQLQCATCHDVHNSSGVDKLLVLANTGSALCLTCHNK